MESCLVDQSKENLEPGDFGWDSSRMYRIDCHKEGVSLIDLVEQRDISCSGIFSHIRVTYGEAQELMCILLDEKIMKEIGEEDGEIRYGIVDNALTLYLEDYLGLHQTRLSIMGRLPSTVRGVRCGTRQDFDMINYLEENMGANAYEYLLKLEKVRRGLSANARAAYKNEIDIYDEEIKSYQKQIKDREKMYEELEERYPVITTIVKMFTTSDYFDRIDERALKRRSQKLQSSKRLLRRLYIDMKNKWQTERELEHMFEECLPERSHIEPKVMICILLNTGFLIKDDPMKTNCRFKLSEERKSYVFSKKWLYLDDLNM